MDPKLRSKIRGKRIGIALSGGGGRAMLFHIGALWHLNDVGLLGKLDAISSVSGGSILAAFLGMKWSQLRFVDDVATNFREVIADPLITFSGRTIDIRAVAQGLLPGTNGPMQLQALLDHFLFEGATLNNLPEPGTGPDIRMNAFVLDTRKPWVFSKSYAGEQYLLESSHWSSLRLRDESRNAMPLAFSVAASAGFPPILSPISIDASLLENPEDSSRPIGNSLDLADGGIYDNSGFVSLNGWPGIDVQDGLRANKLREGRKRTKGDRNLDEPCPCEVVFVSDGGALPPGSLNPFLGWRARPGATLKRTLDTAIDNQRRTMRAAVGKQIESKLLDGAWWEIPFVVGSNSGTFIDVGDSNYDFKLSERYEIIREWGAYLSKQPTVLRSLGRTVTQQLINHGWLKAFTGMWQFAGVAVTGSYEQLPYPEQKMDVAPGAG